MNGESLSQVCTVPEYTNVSLLTGESIAAAPWDGSSGGVVAFLANGFVSIGNSAFNTAAGAGFRGGAYRSSANSTGCADRMARFF